MRKLSVLAAALGLGLIISACGGPGGSSPVSAGSGGFVESAHRVKPDDTSISVAIQNTASSAIALITLNSSCLTGTPPTPIAGGSTGGPFSVTYTTGCAGTEIFDMLYAPTLAENAGCWFDITRDNVSGKFTASVVNEPLANCSDTVAVDGSIAFKYAHL
jgi:hypothetical protein